MDQQCNTEAKCKERCNYIGEHFEDIINGPITLSGEILDITRQETEDAIRLAKNDNGKAIAQRCGKAV